MSNQTIENNNKQIKNIKEETNSIIQQQIQQIAKNASTKSINSNTITTINTNKTNDKQEINKAIFDKSIAITDRYQQQIIKTIKAITDNYYQFQKNILNTYQSAFSKFINYASDNNKSYFAVLEQLKVYNNINQCIIDSTINSTRTFHEFLAEYTDIFNKSIELGQEYYSNEIKNL